MTPSSLNALAALLGAAGFPETWYENGKGIFGKQRSLRARAVHIDGPINFEVAAVHNKGDAALIVAAVNALPSLIEAARREAGLQEALEEAISLPLHGGYQQQQARWRRLLHDNAGATEPAEGTE